MATSAEWHEDYHKMSEAALNFSRAVKSVQEELEAVDWYNQRAKGASDPELRRILEHNRDEEKAEGGEADDKAAPTDGSLGIGSLRETER